MTRKKSPQTIAITAGRHPHDNFGVINPPVYRASTVLYPDLASLRALSIPYTYGRQGGPTHTAFQEAVAELEGGHSCVLAPSGLAAISTALLSFLSAGDHLLMADSVYSPTRVFCHNVLEKFGVDVEYYDPLIGSGLSIHIRDTTKIVFLESPGSQTFEIQDIPAIAEAAHRRGALVMLDNTWSAGYFLRPFELGVDISVQAATKYIAGHSDVMLGIITGTESVHHQIKKGHGNLGITASPDDIYLALRGLRTMPVRLEKHMENGIALARWLETRKEVSHVLHPALPNHPGHAIWKRDFSGACGLFGLVLKPVREEALAAMLDGLEYFGMGYSWGGYESLILPMDPSAQRTATSWTQEGTLLRIHAGLENINDLKADLEAGLERLNAHV